MSNTLSLEIYDSAQKKLKINQNEKNIQISIKRDENLYTDPFKYINTSSIQALSFIYFKLNSNKSNYSLHVQLKPENSSIAYLTLIKFKGLPSLNENSYDLMKISCPSITNKTDYYQISTNMSVASGHTGLIGIGIRELDQNESSILCNEQKQSLVSVLDQKKSNFFTSNFSIRIFLSGCYYYDQIKNEWSSEGVDIDADSTDLEQTHCLSSHLTEFAGGFIVLPAEINFDYVWANASFTRNPVIYTTVIVLCIVYILIAVLCRYHDVNDKKKIGLSYLNASLNDSNGNFYEIMICTGTRKDAGTTAKVFISIYAFYETFVAVRLFDEKRNCFQRCGIDTFILQTKK
jgi:hypothetical protein